MSDQNSATETPAGNAAETPSKAAEGPKLEYGAGVSNHPDDEDFHDAAADAEGDDGQADEDSTTEDDEFEDIEHEGKKHRIPKALKPLMMFQSDYTKKTQETAEERKALATQRESVKGEQEALRTYHKELGEIFALDQAIGQYQKIDWEKWRNDDPLTSMAEKDRLRDIMAERERLAKALLDKDAERQKKANADRDEKIAKGKAEVARDIKGWGPELAQKLVTFARSQGLSDEDIAPMESNPRYVKITHKAMLYDQLIAQQREAAKLRQTQQAQAEQPQPQAKVAANRTRTVPQGLSDDLSTEEWVKRRNAEVKRARN